LERTKQELSVERGKLKEANVELKKLREEGGGSGGGTSEGKEESSSSESDS